MTNNASESSLQLSGLGKETQYPSAYDQSLLYAVPRQLGRQALNSAAPQTWIGADIWTAFEVSWLNPKGKPQVAIVSASFDPNNPYLVESKSFKLYLNSFNQTVFDNSETMLALMQKDLSAVVQGQVSLQLFSTDHFAQLQLSAWNKDSLACPIVALDELDISTTIYHYDPRLLRLQTPHRQTQEVVFSNLLKSNCPVTGQPDWASLLIAYQGPAIDHGSLLQYIISYREHTGFHEACVEQIYCDLQMLSGAQELLVYARYTRRGGLDINPWRASSESFAKNYSTILGAEQRLARQ
ncbi:NADPH-dependent 7-cyano-7-deazaguanine reductase QueF [Brackiella oedipodis]|uniref:NADPH-dependent 7-cyano-7-deazaguanine reductase QueF n=1 Tax=Brackiella oedipodis TaxID=124225 RepID=UPI00048E41D6|nr:NADPH-dependent 7-cyano-7-deazaguanine reductase QueF [Brackiella oedipodis]